MQQTMIYMVSDGKPGHLAQSQGLAQAIGRATPVRIMTIDAHGKRVAPQPSKEAGLILAAGRGTHGQALSLRRYLGLPAVSLMNPGWLMRQRFDLSIIPRHDDVDPSASVIVTEGAINSIRPAREASPNEGLLLIGGPSKHHRWDDRAIQQQIDTIIARQPDMRWTATSSRRTPASTDRSLQAYAQQHAKRFTYTPADQTPPGWVAEQLQRCGTCWVSADSVSMVYEALTAGAKIGLLNVPRKGRSGRVVRGVESLLNRGWVTTFDQWRDGAALSNDREPLAEADRVAALILARWPALRGSADA